MILLSRRKRIRRKEEEKNDEKVTKMVLPLIYFDFVYIVHRTRCQAETAMTSPPLIVRTRSCAVRNLLTVSCPFTNAPGPLIPMCGSRCVRADVHACSLSSKYLAFIISILHSG